MTAFVVKGTPMPTKPSEKNEARETFSLSCDRVELLSIMVLVAISKEDSCVRPLGRMVVVDTLRSSPREGEAERK
jgi:hypothetical protein